MATLTRTRTTPTSPERLNLDTNVPTPFPSRTEWEQEEILAVLAAEELHLESELPSPPRLLSGGSSEVSDGQALTEYTQARDSGGEQSLNSDSITADLLPSIAHAQKSCLTALNDLLPSGANWRPIIPDRRHSMPPGSPSSPTSATFTTSPTHALQTLVHNLRAQNGGNDTSDGSLEHNALIEELRTRIDSLAVDHRLSSPDITLAQSLVALITHLHGLATQYEPKALSSDSLQSSWPALAPAYTHSPTSSTSDPFVRLRRHLSDLQETLGSKGGKISALVESTASPVAKVGTTLLWAHIDGELETVLSLCRARTAELAAPPKFDALPPEYDEQGYIGELGDGLPQYEAASSSHTDDTKVPSSSGVVSEKMRMDLEAVALAIDRLYIVAPQLHNQRVELKKSKVEQMEKARLAGPSSALAGPSVSRGRKGKQTAVDGEEDVHELERIVELIGRASERKLNNQAFFIESGFNAKIEKARRHDLKQRDEFVTQLARHSNAGRLHSQDAVFQQHANLRMHDPEAMLSLPEFIREDVPEPVKLKLQMSDPNAILSLPEFVKEPVPQRFVPPPVPKPPARSRSLKSPRSRSISAPPLAWLLASSRPSSPTSATDAKKTRSSKIRRGGSSSGLLSSLQPGLDVHYVAEFHESLQHVLVFFNASGVPAGANIEAEVLSISDPGGQGREGLLLRSGTALSSLLSLPARVTLGKKDVKVDGIHFQIKLAADPATPNTPAQTPLLDAEQLSACRPSSFVCASCSLPLVQCARLRDYRDLPSEHWAELVDAWMCHSDQKLHEDVQKHSNEGFWPSDGHALVGGSYILLEESLIVKNHLSPLDSQDPHRSDDWQRVRCICGAVIGRSKARVPEATSVAYRLAKYAIRPLGPTADFPKVPLSAFVAEDMNEFVQAHAVYRFVLLDEEEERPRILVWLFKPSMRLAYTTPTQYVIPKHGSIHAAKVLFKILGPTALYSDLQSLSSKYPGFPEAEHLYYPIDICRRLASVLKESNTAYPESMRTMTGLDVGWLQRA